MKTKLGVKNFLFPLPTILVGANVNGKPNYLAASHVGIAAMIHITISIRKTRYTSIGIKENGAFSVNIPSVELVKETDYCGLFSGKDIDKSQLFKSFYGTLGTAPMIESCPINMECTLKQTIDFPTHELFIGEIIETYCEDKYMQDGVLDLERFSPILYGPTDYWKLGKAFAKTRSIGKDLKA